MGPREAPGRQAVRNSPNFRRRRHKIPVRLSSSSSLYPHVHILLRFFRQMVCDLPGPVRRHNQQPTTRRDHSRLQHRVPPSAADSVHCRAEAVVRARLRLHGLERRAAYCCGGRPRGDHICHRCRGLSVGVVDDMLGERERKSRCFVIHFITNTSCEPLHTGANKHLEKRTGCTSPQRGEANGKKNI